MHAQNVFILGASSGIGRQLALDYATRFTKNASPGTDPVLVLALSARRLPELESLRDELKAFPRVVVEILRLDMNDTADVQKCIPELISKLPGRILDVAIVNSGVTGGGKYVGQDSSATLEQVQCLQTNIVGAFAVISVVMEHFRSTRLGKPEVIRERGKAQLVGIGSVASYRALPTSVAYSASKAALDVLLQGIRLEAAPHGYLDVSLINPGYIETAINSRRKNPPFQISVKQGSAIILADILNRVRRTEVPRWPWMVLAFLMRNVPDSLLLWLVSRGGLMAKSKVA
ncbi:hypothetical protein BJ742DRAFT_540597 [Cladochytrium replicatum]|nr:hypothetical protein BJ742DRAFT_540597 [Cladochytrium replicatum]